MLSLWYWLMVETFAVWQQFGDAVLLLSPRPSLEGVLVLNGDYEVPGYRLTQSLSVQRRNSADRHARSMLCGRCVFVLLSPC